jgi:SnoaL-like protein
MGNENRATLDGMIDAMFRSDWDAVGATMADDAVVEYPQSGEHFVGRQACLNVYRNYPGGSPEYELLRISGGPDVFTIEARGDYGGEIVYLTSIVEFRDGKISKQRDYFASAFAAPAWRSEWVSEVSPVG